MSIINPLVALSLCISSLFVYINQFLFFRRANLKYVFGLSTCLFCSRHFQVTTLSIVAFTQFIRSKSLVFLFLLLLHNISHETLLMDLFIFVHQSIPLSSSYLFLLIFPTTCSISFSSKNLLFKFPLLFFLYPLLNLFFSDHLFCLFTIQSFLIYLLLKLGSVSSVSYLETLQQQVALLLLFCFLHLVLFMVLSNDFIQVRMVT